MKPYRANSFSLALWTTALALATIGAIPTTASLIAGDVKKPGLAVLWLVLLAWSWVVALAAAREVDITDDGLISCRAPVHAQSFFAADVLELRGWRFFYPYLVTIVHRKGSVRVIARMDRMGDLIAELKRANPDVELTAL